MENRLRVGDGIGFGVGAGIGSGAPAAMIAREIPLNGRNFDDKLQIPQPAPPARLAMAQTVTVTEAVPRITITQPTLCGSLATKEKVDSPSTSVPGGSF